MALTENQDQLQLGHANMESLDLIKQLRKEDAASHCDRGKTKASFGIDSPMGLMSSFVFAPVYLYATIKGKHTFWDQALSSLPDKTFCGPSLDMGCGRGLVLTKVATRKRSLLRTAQIKDSMTYGIDIFNAGDQSGNSPETLYNNIKSLDLLDSVAVYTASFTELLPFADNYFSLVTASLSLHNVPLAGRKFAVREACRVCKPGGVVIILDLLGYVAEYEAEMRSNGWTKVERRFAGLGVVFGSWPTQVLLAHKPAM